jgi:pantetheine-phosphate adenylyltransferase
MTSDPQSAPPTGTVSFRRAVYPGSFDPVTNGHLDVLVRAASIFDEVIIAPARNSEKAPFFRVEERLDFLRACTGHLPNVVVMSFEGLLVDFARAVGAIAVIRGLRAVSDFEYEFQMALMNRKLHPELETIFLTPKDEYIFLSSRLVREVATLGGNVSDFVPAAVAVALETRRKG